MIGRVMVVAGSDSGGGAGIQGDLKAIHAMGGYGTTAITALTAQNTLGVSGVFPVSPEFVVAQMTAVWRDIGADAVKTGMLGGADVVAAIADFLKDEMEGVPLVLDPVMVAKGGTSLLADHAVVTLRAKLLPLAYLLTPNIPEAEVLTGLKIETPDKMADAARQLQKMGARNVLLKGGHLEADELVDVLASEEGIFTFSSLRIQSRNTHGTGCTLASAIATLLARKHGLMDAVQEAREYLRRAIINAPGLGTGHGPLGH